MLRSFFGRPRIFCSLNSAAAAPSAADSSNVRSHASLPAQSAAKFDRTASRRPGAAGVVDPDASRAAGVVDRDAPEASRGTTRTTVAPKIAPTTKVKAGRHCMMQDQEFRS